MEVASRAATEATMCATKAKDMLNGMHKSFEDEIVSMQHTCLQLQENLKFEKNMVQNVTNEARRTTEEFSKEKEQMWLVATAARAKNLELNELIQKESLSIVEAVVAIKNEKAIASQAAEEARCSALKVGEIFIKALESFNGQMIKIQHMSIQLQVSSCYYFKCVLQSQC